MIVNCFIAASSHNNELKVIGWTCDPYSFVLKTLLYSDTLESELYINLYKYVQLNWIR